MSEQMPSAEGIPTFDELMAEMATSDMDFRDLVISLNGIVDDSKTEPFNVVDMATLETYASPHEEMDLDEVAKEIVGSFNRICLQLRIDPNTAILSPEQYDMIDARFNAEVRNISDEIRPGDVIIATDTLVLESGENTYGTTVTHLLSDGDCVIGTLVTPVIGFMPGMRDVESPNEDTRFGLGSGLLLENPVVVSSDGTGNAEIFREREVVVALDISGVKLSKYVFPTD